MVTRLPPPPPGKTGWPWTEESEHLSSLQSNGNPWPRISIVTPSFNQGQFIEETIRSILLQNYPNLEYIIIDGKSTDNSVDIIRKYEPWITYWISEPDNGQSQAINKGFNKCTGELVNWICSDDMLCKNSLIQFASLYYIDNTFLYIGKCRLVDKRGDPAGSTSSQISNFNELTDLANHWRKNDSIAQQSVLYPLTSVNEIGGVNESNYYTMDYELWGDLLLNNICIKNIPLEIGIYRWYEGQKTSYILNVTNSLVRTTFSLIKRNRNSSLREKIVARKNVMRYYLYFIYHYFRSFLGIRRRLSGLGSYGI